MSSDVAIARPDEISGAPGECIDHVALVIGYHNTARPPAVRDFDNLAKEGAKNGIRHLPLLTYGKSLHSI